MAQLLSPVYTEALKVRNPSLNFCSSNSCRMLPKTTSTWNFVTNSGKRRRWGRIGVAAQDSFSLTDTVADDYYVVLGLLPDATQTQIKKAYYNCMKACHPDLSGNDPETTNICTFINEVYAVLSDPVQRMVYDEIHGCIGCKNCANVASDVLAIKEDFGKARAYTQCRKSELVQHAIESCPVDCIHWTSAAQLSLLEDEMRRIERVIIALMLTGMGSALNGVFRMASS
ncbi:unnamed protein product [Lupinus luteus]|uniref:J domain-containing protein n=1 Tax=Lupinus luteus TaxID=3873 RepID=A0AAV1XNV8_LUPLU